MKEFNTKKKFTPSHPLDVRLFALAKKICDVEGILPTNHKGTSQRRAWVAWRKSHGMKYKFHERAEVITVIAEYPPADLDALSALEMQWADKGTGASSSTRKALSYGQ